MSKYKLPFILIILFGIGCSTTGTKTADSQIHSHKTEKMRSPQEVVPDNCPRCRPPTMPSQDCPDLTGTYKGPSYSTFLTHQQKMVGAEDEKITISLEWPIGGALVYRIKHNDATVPDVLLQVNGKPNPFNDKNFEIFYCEGEELFSVSLDFNDEAKIHGVTYSKIKLLKSGMEHRLTGLDKDGQKETGITLYVRQ